MKNRNYIIAPLVVCFIFLTAFSCKDIQSTQSENNSFKTLNVSVLTEQHFVPGMESNIRKTIKYELEISCEILEDITFKNLIIDSVKVPFSSIIEIEKKRGRNGEFRKGTYDSIKLMCMRLIFVPNHPKPMIEEVLLEKHGYQNLIEGEAYLEYSTEDDRKIIPLGEITKLKTVIAP